MSTTSTITLFNCLVEHSIESSNRYCRFFHCNRLVERSIESSNRYCRFFHCNCLVEHSIESLDTVDPSTTASTMAFTADNILQFVLLATWTCLVDTPFNQKNTLFARFFTSQAVFEQLASTASLVFSPGLFEELQAATSPTIHFFKSLPTDTTSRWGIYVIVLEKLGCRFKIYIGSGTNGIGGVQARLKQYDDSLCFPSTLRRL